MLEQLKRLLPLAVPIALLVFLQKAPGAENSSGTTLEETRADDAHLFDVQFVGSDVGYAAGDLGVVWKSTDGGRSWQRLATPVKGTLRKICFLTDRIGWIVGTETQPYSRIGRGIVLHTTDGGETWHELAKGKLPRLFAVKFFGPEEGYVAGDSTANAPTGVFSTTDGGRTWYPLVGKRTIGWRAADFAATDAGIVGSLGGLQGKISLVSGQKLLAPRLDDLGLRQLRDIELHSDESGWIVGDGGLVLKTDSGGTAWTSPRGQLPRGIRDVCDFRAVSTQKQHVWVAGSPGSVVWYSPDAGRNWIPQQTRESPPIEGLHFSSKTEGCAVGALGLILRTEDAGETWQTVRGGNRRVAMMSVHAAADRVRLETLARFSGDKGYRSLVATVPRRDLGPDGPLAYDTDQRLHDAVVAAGGSAAEVGWRLPLEIPGIDRDRGKLVREWNGYTEGKLEDVLVGTLVRRLRTWRPSIVIIDQPARNDFATQLLNTAVLRAVEQSGDATRFLEHGELAGLKPWSVEKVFMRLAAGSRGQTEVVPFEFLEHLKQTAHRAAIGGYSLLLPGERHTAESIAYRLVYDREGDPEGSHRALDLFRGLLLYPGGEARRPLVPVDEEDAQRYEELARRQRNFRAYTARALDNPQRAAGLVAHMRQVMRDMPDPQAAQVLLELAREYRSRGQWELVEATYVELIERFPSEPAALEAMRWLFQFWSSTETAWQRSREYNVQQIRMTSSEQDLAQRIKRAIELRQTDPLERPDPGDSLEAGTLIERKATGRITTKNGEDWRAGRVRDWQSRALELVKTIEKYSPELHGSVQIQFPLAATRRKAGGIRAAEGIYRSFNRADETDPWRQTAFGELWVQRPLSHPPKPLTISRRSARPTLDAVLSDDCWQNARALRLRDRTKVAPATKPQPLVMLAHDDEYLYVSASVPKDPGIEYQPTVTEGRSHDADLANSDRLSLYLDVDRDYATWYAFHVDQRGLTAESCWEDARWNPKWHVASNVDESRWRFEIAIPLDELTPHGLPPGTVWAVGITRTIPAEGVETWPLPTGSKPRPEAFGLVRFD